MQAQYNAAQLITKREEVSRRIRSQLENRAKDFSIKLDDVSIVRNPHFPIDLFFFSLMVPNLLSDTLELWT